MDALKESDADSLKERMIALMNTYISARQMGESEVFIKIFPDFNLKNSNVTTVFIPVSKKENRSKYLVKVDEKENYNGKEKMKIEGREGFYVEKYDIVSKFERLHFKQDNHSELSFSHFAKMYSPAWKVKGDDTMAASEDLDVKDANENERIDGVEEIQQAEENEDDKEEAFEAE